MALERKHIFLIAGSALLVSAIVIGIYLIVRKPSDEKDESDEKEKGNGSGNENEDRTKQPPSSSPAPTNTSSIQNGQVVPIFNEENELKNSMEQLKGVLLYPKRKWQGGADYTNVRSSAEVNTESAWYDPFDNLLTTDPSTKIATKS